MIQNHVAWNRQAQQIYNTIAHVVSSCHMRTKFQNTICAFTKNYNYNFKTNTSSLEAIAWTKQLKIQLKQCDLNSKLDYWSKLTK